MLAAPGSRHMLMAENGGTMAGCRLAFTSVDGVYRQQPVPSTGQQQ